MCTFLHGLFSVRTDLSGGLTDTQTLLDTFNERSGTGPRDGLQRGLRRAQKTDPNAPTWQEVDQDWDPATRDVLHLLPQPRAGCLGCEELQPRQLNEFGNNKGNWSHKTLYVYVENKMNIQINWDWNINLITMIKIEIFLKLLLV